MVAGAHRGGTMKKARLSIVVLLLVSAVASGQTTRRREPPPPADAATVEAIVAALYGSVSHAPETSPNWERMRAIFLPVGMLVPPRKPEEAIFTVIDVDGFEERYKKSMAAAKEKGTPPTGFYEKELSRRTDCFGNICQIFSTYESRHTESDAKPFVRGINSIQLLRDGQRWWIASVIWDVERSDNPIPAPYLPAAK
jgi:hypothetical protein